MHNDNAQRVATTSAMRAIPKLVEAGKLGMGEKCLEIGEEIASLLEVGMPSVSERIRKVSKSGTLKPIQVKPPEDLLEYVTSDSGFNGVVLPDHILSEANMIMAEHSRAAELASFDVAARHKIILHGPPGNGKTMLAQAFAAELGLPLFEVKYGGLIASYLGETGKNLQRLFDYANAVPCVLFVDEFDTISVSRTSESDVGEARRVTNQILLLLDRLSTKCFFVAATNLYERIDPAVARRFHFALEIPAPTDDLIRKCAARELEPSRTPGYDRTDLVESIVRSGPQHLSAVVDLCQWIRRDLCLTGGMNIESRLAQ